MQEQVDSKKMTLTRVKLATKSFPGEPPGRLPRLTLSSADWFGTTSAARSSTAAYLVQTVFAVRLRVNFHFHHHRIRTSNVAQHFCFVLFFWPCLLGVFGFKSMRQLWSVLEAPPLHRAFATFLDLLCLYSPAVRLYQ